MSSPRATCERAICGGWACTGWCGRGTRPGGDPRVAYLHDRSALTLVADQTVSAQIDGEFVGRLERAELVYEPDAVRVFVPTGSSLAAAPAAAGT